MSLIDEFMPRSRLRQVDHLAVASDPARTFAAVRGIDLYQVNFARWLFALRLVPEQVMAFLRKREPPLRRTAHIDQITAPGSGFHLLAENDHEIVIGAIGRFWHPAIPFVDITPDTFRRFHQPGWGKLTWALSVAPRGNGSWITVDVRVDATDDVSWKKFTRYWRLVGPFSHAIRHGALRMLRRQLGGAAPDDIAPLAGDERLPDAPTQLTHAIDIEAPPAKIWPWLLQMGGQRAGWYSWDHLDNGGKPSATRIMTEQQHLAVGDVIPARPTGSGGFEVLEVVPGRHLILGSTTPLFDGTWTFSLEPIGEDATHFVTRYRADYEAGPRMAFVRPVITPIHAFMERKQLRTIKERAERRP
jgi:hypothetical protein